MAKILGIGVATLDIINTTAAFPNEDSKVRAISQRINRGGNVCNSLIVLSQLGNDCSWCGTLGDDNAATTIRSDLARHNIDISHSQTILDGRTPTSYITVNQLNGSRTIVHYRDLPELDIKDFTRLDLSNYACCHFEGRNIEHTAGMIAHLKLNHPSMVISVEIEKPRTSIEKLYPGADLLFFSREFAQHKGYTSAANFLINPSLDAVRQGAMLICTWGDQGAWLKTPGQELHHQAAIAADPLIDTLGAGDTFIAGFLHKWLLEYNAHAALEFAAAIAAKKCSQTGFEQLVEPS